MRQLAQFVQVAFIFVAAFAVYSFVATARDGERRSACGPLCHLQPNYAGENRLAPDFELDTTRRAKVRLSSFRGKVVILNFWTKNCRPCLEEMPSLGEFAQSLRDEPDIAVIAVSTDESVEDVQNTLRSVLGRDPPFVAAVDPESAVVAGKYGTRLYPETWLIDANGVIRARFDGARDWTSSMVLDLVKNIRDPISCSVEFENGRSIGDEASVCEDIAG
jgi:thiol-disulfide isomerase/thioredoxin